MHHTCTAISLQIPRYGTHIKFSTCIATIAILNSILVSLAIIIANYVASYYFL